MGVRMMSFHGSAEAADRDAEIRTEKRRAGFRRLHLIHGGKTFLRRVGVDLSLFGIYLHRIDAPDPGLDVHDHPWAFISIILRGGYTEEYAEARVASIGPAVRPNGVRTWRRGSVHYIPLTIAHRIMRAEPGTVTLVIRTRKLRPWGFFTPEGWIDQRVYDYETRRPVVEHRP